MKHTDVLILDQFVDSKGEMISREDLGICSVSTKKYFVFLSDNIPELVSVSAAVEPVVQVGPDGPAGRPHAWQGTVVISC